MRLIHLVGVTFGAGLAFLAAAGGAQAYDHRERDHWRHEHWRHDYRHDYRHDWHHGHDRTVVVRERPVYVERTRPVFVQPAPMYAAPMYQQSPGPSGLNLNFNIPLN